MELTLAAILLPALVLLVVGIVRGDIDITEGMAHAGAARIGEVYLGDR